MTRQSLSSTRGAVIAATPPGVSGTGICHQRPWYVLGARRSQQDQTGSLTPAGTLSTPYGGRERVTGLPAFLTRAPGCCPNLLSQNSRSVPAPGFSRGLDTFISLTPCVLCVQTQAPAFTFAPFRSLSLERLIWKLGAATLCCGTP